MPRHVRLAWAVLLASCVDLTQPPELRPRDPTAVGNDDAGEDASESAPDVAVPGTLSDADPPAVDAPGPAPILEPDAGDPTVDASTADATIIVPPPPDLAPDLPPPDAPLRANGSACTAGGQCQSGQCVDAFCCNLPCNGRCQACDVAGSEGRCTPIKAGDDPDNECALEAVATCGRDGTCDGQGACRKYPVGMQCMPGSCTGSMETGASLCTAAGTCQAGTTKMCTGGHTCMNGSCASMCNADGECQTGFFCDNKTCQVKRPAGATCSATNQCASGFCVDGVCCNTACDQTCYACDLPGSMGACNPIPDGQERGAVPECPKQDMTTCGRMGGCNGRGACRLYATGATCGPQACTGGVQSDARKCNGTGTCDPPATHDCGTFACNGTACGTTCTTAAQCKAGHACVGNTCRLIKVTSLVVHDTDATRKGQWSLQQNFQPGMTGAHPWGDQLWLNTYVKCLSTTSPCPATTPADFLLGKEWIRVSAESKKYSGGPQATITLSAASTVYLVVDDRWPGSPPAWLAGWTNTNLKVTIDEPPTRPMLPFTLYRKITTAGGTLDLPAIACGSSCPGYDYFIVVD
jgi:hypothetical protein